jgi:hypothetical protein
MWSVGGALEGYAQESRCLDSHQRQFSYSLCFLTDRRYCTYVEIKSFQALAWEVPQLSGALAY